MSKTLASFLQQPLPEPVYDDQAISFTAPMVKNRLQMYKHQHTITALPYTKIETVTAEFGNIRKLEFTLTIPNPNISIPQEVRANTFMSIELPDKTFDLVVIDSRILNPKNREETLSMSRSVQVHYKDLSGGGPIKTYSCSARVTGSGETVWEAQKNLPPQIKQALKEAAETAQQAMDETADVRKQAFDSLRKNHRTKIGHRARTMQPADASQPSL